MDYKQKRTPQKAIATKPEPPSHRAHMFLVLIALWCIVAACPRPPASIELESVQLDGSWTSRQESTSEVHADEGPRGDAKEAPVKDASTSTPSEPGVDVDGVANDSGPQDTKTDTNSPEPKGDKGTPMDTTPTACPPAPTKDTVDTLTAWQPIGFAPAPEAKRLPRCQGIGFRIVAPAEMEIQVDVAGLPRQHAFALGIYNARRINRVAQDQALATANSAAKDYISLKFKVDKSGELGIVLYGYQHPKEVPFTIQAFCTKQCQRETSRFPVVLMHGLAGTDKYFGILDYFYGVKSHLEKAGYAVFTPKVQPVANSKTRVLTLKKQIDDILKQTGARKLNLIAHSQGGVDGRLLISAHGYHDRVASLTTISTPHRGVPIPNVLIPPSQELGESNMKKYNQQYPNHPQVQYFSWAGVSCGFLDRSCRKQYKDETIDPLLLGTYQAIKAARGPNDGLVPVSSAKWGTFLGEIPADHWDEIGQVADRNNKSFNHKDFYLNEAKRLKKLDF